MYFWFRNVLKTITSTINASTNRSSEIEWDGKNEYGGKIGHGIYIYQIQVTTAEGAKAQKAGKLIAL